MKGAGPSFPQDSHHGPVSSPLPPCLAAAAGVQPAAGGAGVAGGARGHGSAARGCAAGRAPPWLPLVLSLPGAGVRSPIPRRPVLLAVASSPLSSPS